MKLDVYRLAYDCNKDLTLIPDLGEYFWDHFIGSSMKETWQPPQMVIEGKRRRIRDFVSWSAQAPVISEKTKRALEPLIRNDAEILPLGLLKGMPYYSINVTTLVNCLDYERSDVVFSADGSERIMSINRAFFRDNCIPPVPIFKLSNYPGDVYVTHPFVDAVLANNLKGAEFADPRVSPFAAILHGHTENVVEGVLGLPPRGQNGTPKRKKGSSRSTRGVQNRQEPVERPLEPDEQSEVTHFATEGRKMLPVGQEATSTEEVVRAIMERVDTFRAPGGLPPGIDLQQLILGLACLWAEQVRLSLGWAWVALTLPGEAEPRYALVSQDRTYATLPLYTFQRLLEEPDQDNTVLLLFHMLKEQRFSPSEPGQYKLVG